MNPVAASAVALLVVALAAAVRAARSSSARAAATVRLAPPALAATSQLAPSAQATTTHLALPAQAATARPAPPARAATGRLAPRAPGVTEFISPPAPAAPLVSPLAPSAATTRPAPTVTVRLAPPTPAATTRHERPAATARARATDCRFGVLERAASLPADVIRRSRRRADADLPLALETAARSLRAGSSLRQALSEAGALTPGPVGDDLGHVATAAARGVPLVDALDAWGARARSPAVVLAASALALAAEAGGTQARAVDGVAATLRERLAVDAEVRALSAQARLSAIVIALAPLVFGALAVGTDGRTAAFLFGRPFGWVCLVGGLTLDALAAWWMLRITRGGRGP